LARVEGHDRPRQFAPWARLGAAATAIGALAWQARRIGWASTASGLGACVVGDDIVLLSLAQVARR
jgi:hypothetical protein